MTGAHRPTIRQRLYHVAVEQYGYVTTRDAKERGIPAVELGKLAYRGKLEKRGRSIYRFPHFPVTDRDPMMEAVLWGGRGALLSHDAVLALYDLADANPRTIRVTVPRRVRRRARPDITLIRGEVPANERTVYFGIPSTTIARALLDSRHLLMPTRLLLAAEEARTRGLLLAREHTDVLVAFKAAG